jgi:CheY-like chemotaxis protein
LVSSLVPPTQIILMLSSPLDAEGSNECKRLGISTILKPIRRLILQQALVGERHAPATAAPVPVAAGNKASTSRLRILLAEDNAVNQRLISRILEKMGHMVVVANDGAVALDLLSRQEFDLVAMDMQMPIMDGLEATQKIRLIEKGTDRHTPIMAITANAFDDDRRRCLEAGMDGYVVKPVTAQALGVEMGRVLVRLGAKRAAASVESETR